MPKDPNPDLRKPHKDLTAEQQKRESDEHEAGAPARDDQGNPIE
jgi:hypothetical protein